MIAVRKLRGTHLGLPLTLTQPRWDLAFFERTCGNIQVEVTLPKGWGGELMADGISLGALGETRWNHDAIDWLFLELVAYDMRIGTCRFCYNYRSLYVPGPVSHLQQLCKLMAWPSWLDFGKEANSGTKSYLIFHFFKESFGCYRHDFNSNIWTTIPHITPSSQDIYAIFLLEHFPIRSLTTAI